jgi:hypothetical protein
MPRTYEPIASIAPSAASTIDFQSIPTTYTDLVVVYALTHSAGTQDMWLRFNGDTGSTNPYSHTVLYGTGSTAGSYRGSSGSRMLLDYYAIPGTSEQAINVIQIMSYTNANVFTTVLAAAARAGNGVDRVVGLWRQTDAITSVQIFPGSGTVTGNAALYGIKAA